MSGMSTARDDGSPSPRLMASASRPANNSWIALCIGATHERAPRAQSQNEYFVVFGEQRPRDAALSEKRS